jgi:hypothetical protein
MVYAIIVVILGLTVKGTTAVVVTTAGADGGRPVLRRHPAEPPAGPEQLLGTGGLVPHVPGLVLPSLRA